MKSVQGKNVLVTGAAMGMGRLFAERAIAEGAAHVVLWDLQEERLNQTLAELADAAAAHGVTLSGFIVDVSDLDDVKVSADAVRADIGHVDVLVNNAGVVRGNTYFWESDSTKDTKLTVDVNTLAPMYVAREFLPGMIANSADCRVLNLSSAAGFTPNPRMAVYAASKWAVIGWSDSVRLELKQAGIAHVMVTTVCPYYVNTGMFAGAKSAPLLPILEPDHVVDEAWKGMLAGSPFVILPKTVVLSEVLKGLVPIGVRDFIADNIIGVYHTMEDFTGRTESKA
ncbi:MAG TPA: SDR family NAD(P)-dependent oxidoreductase [Dermatophilaceae bacterium]|nr:SDR family NAD(P)-dependent oxidoreductase [Actinomycetales bacterium]HMT32337.1 SDR family NAD(P)-dependent oxidoreductase [Dermatophilaceae bacterium]HMT89941.1 SDR family NAD(P)-dependent oxidoreductase [Dermatophilaceae bacterium]